MRFCPWLQAVVGRWRRRSPRPKQTVDYLPTPRLDPPRLVTPGQMRQAQKGLFRAGRPGMTMVARDGTEYIVQKDGSWRRA